jgi:hypothetical protein
VPTSIPLRRGGPAAQRLAQAALRLDPVEVQEIIETAVTTDGVVDTWNRLLRPVLVGIGEKHTVTAELIEVEHLLSRCVSQAFTTTARPGATSGPPRTLLSCADEEQHTLPLEALAAALAHSGVPSRLLGARVPTPALRRAIARTQPVSVVVWSHSWDTGDPAQLVALLADPHRPQVLVAAGPGWRTEGLPAGVLRPATLTDAVSLTLAVERSFAR